MRNTTLRATLVAMVMLCVGSIASASDICRWEGTAPACNGECDPGYTLVKRGKEGDGKKCITGTKAYCCKTSEIRTDGKAPFCNGKCKPGEEMLGDSDKGENGNKCLTGKAALCAVRD